MADRAPWDLVPPRERRLLAPEDARWVGFDLPENLVDAARRKVVVAVPATVAIGPVQAPIMVGGTAAELGDAYLGPFGQVGGVRGTAVEDADRALADGGFDPDLWCRWAGTCPRQYFRILARSVSGGVGI